MRHNREFEIAWQGLKPGEHIFEYEVSDSFLHEHGEEGTDFKDLRAMVRLKFDKKASFFMLHFDIGGQVTVPCDRCGDDFPLNLWDEFDLIIKLAGEDAEEISDEADVVFIPRSETVLDIGKWVYEFVMLSIPLQRIHPQNADGEATCNPDALKLLEQLKEHPNENAPNNNLWKGLDALKPNQGDKQ